MMRYVLFSSYLIGNTSKCSEGLARSRGVVYKDAAIYWG